jgi:large conductance mechanosensitive channel protein
VIIGAAFGGIVTSLVKDILMPPIGLVTGGLDFSNKFLVLKAGADGMTNFATPTDAVAHKAITWNYGNFITLAINFAIVAFCIFLLVKAMNKMKKGPEAGPPTTKECPLCCKTYHMVASVEESKRLNALEGPAIIIAGSGMATGGRILHHFVRRLSDERTTVLFVGYQAAGTRGRLLREGAREMKMLGQSVPVRATIMVSDSYSAHADQAEILRWLGGFSRPPQVTYLVHGEPDAATALQALIASQLKWRAVVAQDGQRVNIG